LEPWPDTVQWRPVSSRLIWVEEIQLLFGLVPMLGGALVLWFIFDLPVLGWLAAAVVVVAAVRAAFIPRMVSAWGYAERERDLLVRHGRLVRRLSIVPYARMQFVDVTAGPMERTFGLATVQLHTAAAASDARVPGLPPDEASRLRDRLASLGEDRAEGL
jgi:membrane protein YdbS with pleckstrin-like domain